MKNIFIIDDSALMRRILSDIINSDEELHNDKYAVDGLNALEVLERGAKFDAIILDIKMPRMDGIEFLREVNKRGYKEKIVIVSTIAEKGAKETIQALELGAFDFVKKPDSLAETKSMAFGRRLNNMIRAATGLKELSPINAKDADKLVVENFVEESVKVIKERTKAQKAKIDRSELSEAIKITSIRNAHSDRHNHVKGTLGPHATKLVALACSTGGPKALQYVVPFLPANLDAAVLIVQHMPKGFTLSLSKRLDELSRIHVKEAEDGEILRKGTVYVAKGGSQMRVVEKSKSSHSLMLTNEGARNGLNPCADIMYESLMNTSFDEIVCVVMTGMGADGTNGILQLEQTNKIYVIGQDAQSCTVYGMPKAIADVGAVDEVVTLRGIADAITRHVGVL